MSSYTQHTPAEVAQIMSDFVNGARKEHIAEFVEEMGFRTHRTLQQTFTRLCLEWFKHLAGLGPDQYDLRNAASVEAAQKIGEALDFADPYSASAHLPCI